MGTLNEPQGCLRLSFLGGTMGLAAGVVLCLAYILGLLSTVVKWGGVVLLVAGVAAASTIPRWWRASPRSRLWFAAGLIGFLASLYFQLRSPQPAITDISQLVSDAVNGSVQVKVQGQIEEFPRLTRSQKVQLWVAVQQVESVTGEPQTTRDDRPLTGKLYVTVPRSQAASLHPGQVVQILGKLYKPTPATNPGGFDFQAYLAQEGSFAGMRGEQVTVIESPTGWGWWMVQRQIVRSQAQGLGTPAGPLTSAMVLGGRSVDLPFDLKDQFVRAGLAHALAASGFQTSLILGVLLALTRRCSVWVQFVMGTAALVGFVGLTGLQPAVLRAAIMGFGGLAALVLGRKVKPLGALLVTATILLLINPLWIWSLSFQLSFLATLGLLVTVPPISKGLDWLPGGIVPLIAVPIAALVWTLPLQLYAFGVVSPYSILANILTTPLISILSIGGMVSALAALVESSVGSLLASWLAYPAQALIATVDFFDRLPANTYAVGTISGLSAIALYGLIALTGWQSWWQRRWWVALLMSGVLVFGPAWQARATQFQVTVLATGGRPVMVIQDGRRTGLINSGDRSIVNFAILPFLQKQGVNRLDWAISLEAGRTEQSKTTARSSTQTQADHSAPGWSALLERMPIQSAYSLLSNGAGLGLAHAQSAKHPDAHHLLTVGQLMPLGSTQLQLVQAQPTIATLQFRAQTWLWLEKMPVDQQARLAQLGQLPPAQVLWWSGGRLHPDVIAAIRPRWAIATGDRVAPKTVAQLEAAGVQLYWTGRDGALQWTPRSGFKPLLESNEAPSFAL